MAPAPSPSAPSASDAAAAAEPSSAAAPFAATPELVGARVRLAPLSVDDAEALGAAASDGRLWENWYTSVPTPDGMAEGITWRLGQQRAGTMAPWRVDDARGTPVGMTTYCHIDAENRRVEIGYTWIAASAQGSGLNPEAKLLLLGRAFDELDCIAVEFRTHWHNRQSREAIARLGARQDGVLRNHQIGPEGSMRDTVVFSIVRDEWSAVRLGLEHRLARRG